MRGQLRQHLAFEQLVFVLIAVAERTTAAAKIKAEQVQYRLFTGVHSGFDQYAYNLIRFMLYRLSLVETPLSEQLAQPDIFVRHEVVGRADTAHPRPRRVRTAASRRSRCR